MSLNAEAAANFMSWSSNSTSSNFLPQSFGSSFWNDHAGTLIKDPQIAVVELVANSWDAGADRVDITWSEKPGEIIKVEDNGIGMTFEDFRSRWPQLNYNRVEGGQGLDVIFPEGKSLGKRKAYGKNGKGRHSMFCFNFEYTVETWRNGKGNTFEVTKHTGKEAPFLIEHKNGFDRNGSGTSIYTHLLSESIKLNTLKTLIGTKFIADPSFNIFINKEKIELDDIESAIEKRINVSVPPYGDVAILLINSKARGRTSHQHGVAWWVNKRVVGTPSWDGIEIGKYVDRRSRQARQYTFVVQADLLEDEVKADWTWFNRTPKSQAVIDKTNNVIQSEIALLFDDVRRDRKKAVLRDNKDKITGLSEVSKQRIGEFIDGVQTAQPAISEKDLSVVVGVMSNLEAARTGYKLLEQLAQLSPNDFDNLSDLLSRWSVTEMRVVLDELERRLRLIKELESVVEKKSDELHQIHPLFERGLWIFGPEYESIEFTSNKHLITVMRKLLKDNSTEPAHPQTRPDFVVLPDESVMRVFSRDNFADDKDGGEVNGISKVLIIELKRGDLKITRQEMWQTMSYASEIKKSGKLLKTAQISGFVLGTSIDEEAADPFAQGNISITATPYSTILRKAHNRTLRLIEKIEDVTGKPLFDNEVKEIIEEPREMYLL